MGFFKKLIKSSVISFVLYPMIAFGGSGLLIGGGSVADPLTNQNGITIDRTGDNSLLVRQDSSGDTVLTVDSQDFSSLSGPGYALEVYPNGEFNEITFGSQPIHGLYIFGTGDSGTLSSRFRGFHSQIRISGNASSTGVSAAGPRAFHSATVTTSTGTINEMNGGQITSTANSAGSVAVGAITLNQGLRVKAGNDSLSGSSNVTTNEGIIIINPNTDANHTMGTNIGLSIEDQDGTGITDGYAIKTGTGKVDLGDRLNTNKGLDVASASTITLGRGNVFAVTGTTTINHITTTGWKAGSIIVLKFTASVTVTHNASTPPANTAAALLSGSGNFNATANDNLGLMYDGGGWVEIFRTVI